MCKKYPAVVHLVIQYSTENSTNTFFQRGVVEKQGQKNTWNSPILCMFDIVDIVI